MGNFNLHKALSGHKVVNSDGNIVKILGINKNSTGSGFDDIIGQMDRALFVFSKEGKSIFKWMNLKMKNGSSVHKGPDGRDD